MCLSKLGAAVKFRQLSCLAKGCLSVSLIVTIISAQFFVSGTWRSTKTYNVKVICQVPKEVRSEAASMAHNVSKVLNDHGVEHALCYGSHVGVLQYGGLLPWENHVHICVLKSQIGKLTPNMLTRLLSPVGLSITYNYRQGKYVITKHGAPLPHDHDGATVFIEVFHMTKGDVAQRGGDDGWFWSMFAENEKLTFPAVLMKGPMKTLRFEGEQMPVPNGDGEILKYFYPNDWWRSLAPPGCA